MRSRYDRAKIHGVLGIRWLLGHFVWCNVFSCSRGTLEMVSELVPCGRAETALPKCLHHKGHPPVKWYLQGWQAWNQSKDRDSWMRKGKEANVREARGEKGKIKKGRKMGQGSGRAGRHVVPCSLAETRTPGWLPNYRTWSLGGYSQRRLSWVLLLPPCGFMGLQISSADMRPATKLRLFCPKMAGKVRAQFHTGPCVLLWAAPSRHY